VITGSGRYIWTVQAQCSPNVISVPDTGATFQLNCKIGEEEIGGREIISLYPNPSDDFIAISLAINQEIDELTLIEILDQAGKLVTASPVKIENGLINERLSISHFQSGFYYIRIKVNRMEYLCKLVIQNR
jgi:hypothetical protein